MEKKRKQGERGKQKPTENMKHIKCQNEKCGYDWWSKTRMMTVTCPSCHYTVFLNDKSVLEEKKK